MAKSIYLLIYVYIYTGCRETRDTFIGSSLNIETTRTALPRDDFILQLRVKAFEPLRNAFCECVMRIEIENLRYLT